jgi:hypothetical protein
MPIFNLYDWLGAGVKHQQQIHFRLFIQDYPVLLDKRHTGPQICIKHSGRSKLGPHAAVTRGAEPIDLLWTVHNVVCHAQSMLRDRNATAD